MIYLGLFLAAAIGIAPAAGAADDYTKTRYPIFLAEGFGGTNYFEIAAALTSSGGKVCVRNDDAVPSYQDSAHRIPVLITQIKKCADDFHTDKVNFIGFSLGGEDGRAILGEKPELLASVTTVASPNRGSSQLPDLVLSCVAKTQQGIACAANEQAALGAFMALGPLVADPDTPPPAPGTPEFQGALAALCQFSSGTAPLALLLCKNPAAWPGGTPPIDLQFNLKYPAGLPAPFSCGNGAESVSPKGKKIYLFSWTGVRTTPTSADPSDVALAATGVFFAPENDGLVERCSAHFGKVIKDNYVANHLDEVNQLMGQVSPSFNPKEVFRQHANRLKNLGI